MAKVINAVAQALEHLDVANRRVCVGLSGGLDSVVLLTALRELAPLRNFDLGAAHINHGLNPRAHEWVRFCTNLCRELDVPLVVETVVVDLNAGLGTEAAARAARYEAFAKIETDFLALAHHADDQVETLLIQLLRGSGAAGLSAMPGERVLVDQGARLLRPLLALARSELEQFAGQRSLEWVEDDSNADLSLDRNFLRHSLLPVLAKRFPAYRETLYRVTRNLADAAELVNVLGQQDMILLRDAGAPGGGLRIDVLREWPGSRALNALRCVFRTQGYSLPHRAALEEALRQVLEARQSAAVRVDFGNVSLRRYRDHCFLVGNQELPAGWSAKWTGQDSVSLPSGLGALRFRRDRGAGLSVQALQGVDLSVSFRRGGERLAVAANRPHRDLRKLFQEAGIAPWVRERTPVVLCGKRVAFVPGLGLAAEFQGKPGEPSIEIEWIQR